MCEADGGVLLLCLSRAAGYNPAFPFWDVLGAAARTVSKASPRALLAFVQMQGGWRGSDSVLAWGCTANKMLSPPDSKGKGL